jgi:hypothetical protein
MRDTTIGATRRKIEELGFAVTSATCPNRFPGSHWATAGQRASLYSMSDHPAAVLTYPTAHHAPEYKDDPKAALSRGIVLLIVTAFLQSDPRQFKAVMPVLERYNLTSGPYRTDGFGNRMYPVQWNGSDPIWADRGARLAYPDDDGTVVFKQQAIPHERYQTLVNQIGAYVQCPLDEIGTHWLPLDGEWKQGHLLDCHRRALPELFPSSLNEILEDVERARWFARPAATSKEAA